MVEAIESGEVFANVVATYTGDPKHTVEGHEFCAYYAKTSEITPDVSDVIFIDMECPHGVSAGGGFYSEDYVRKLKHYVHRHIAFWDEMEKLFKIGEKRTHINVYFTNELLMAVKLLVEESRELTR